MKKLFLGFLSLNLLILAGDTLASDGEKRMFTVTGYYSPLPNQSFYVTGSYEAEIRLNGRGIAGADGTPVFPGMIAAPSSYTFGTKVCLPNFGCGAVHDRGGAIVHKGERNLARHDRLDLWMGHGEEGLARALELGVWQTEGTIYPASADVELGVNFKAASPIIKILDLPQIRTFSKNLSKGTQSPEVKDLKEALAELGLYGGEIDESFGEDLVSAVLDFQIKYLVIADKDSAGAGVFGPMTREKLSEAVYEFEAQREALERWGKFNFENNFSKGKRNKDVWKLQEMLIQAEFLDHKPTGYFGKMTEAALIEYQLAKGIIKSSSQTGAGNVGPSTREALNLQLASTQDYFALESETISQINQRYRKLQFALGTGTGSNLIAKK